MQPSFPEIKIVLAEKQSLFRNGLCSLLNNQPGMQIVADTDDHAETLRMVEQHDPDLVITSVNLNSAKSGADVTKDVLAMNRGVRVIVVTSYDRASYLKELLIIGARGYLLKQATEGELTRAVTEVMAGGVYVDSRMIKYMLPAYLDRVGREFGKASNGEQVSLTKRELEVCRLIAAGSSNAEVANQICVSRRTVESHRRNINAKLGTRSRAALVNHAVEQGLMMLTA